MDIFIDGISYPGKGEFVFGPDISENLACTNAMQKAKQEVKEESEIRTSKN